MFERVLEHESVVWVASFIIYSIYVYIQFYNIQFTLFSIGSFCQVNRVTDEALIAETAVWPNSFFMNIFFALKGSKLFIIIGKTLLIDPNKFATEINRCSFSCFDTSSSSETEAKRHEYRGDV